MGVVLSFVFYMLGGGHTDDSEGVVMFAQHRDGQRGDSIRYRGENFPTDWIDRLRGVTLKRSAKKWLVTSGNFEYAPDRFRDPKFPSPFSCQTLPSSPEAGQLAKPPSTPRI